MITFRTRVRRAIARRPITIALATLSLATTLVLVLGSVAPSATHDNARPLVLDPNQAFTMAQAGDLVLIDVRTREEWRETGIPRGARKISIQRPDGWPGFVADVEKAVGANRDYRIALICAAGVRSSRASRRLIAAGFTRVHDVRAGMLGRSSTRGTSRSGWLERGLPTEPCDC